MTTMPDNRYVRLDVTNWQDETRIIRSFELAAPGNWELPEFTAGAHVIVHLPGGFERR